MIQEFKSIFKLGSIYIFIVLKIKKSPKQNALRFLKFFV